MLHLYRIIALYITKLQYLEKVTFYIDKH
jgi:hypothetical protein